MNAVVMRYANLLRDALNLVREPILILDQELRIVFTNRAWNAFFSVNDFCLEVGTNVEAFWPNFSQSILGRSEHTCEFLLSTGKQYAVKLALHHLSSGEVVLEILAGLSKNEALSEFHNQRLETLGLLAGGIAHDFNNILAGILGHVTYLKTVLPARGEHVESLAAVEEGGKKASLMTQQILNFSKLEMGATPKQLNLSELVQRTTNLLRGAISPMFQIEQSLPQEALYVEAIEGGLAQVLVNLAINARDALSENGRIKISLSRATNSELPEALKQGSCEYALLKVEDNGHGIPEDLLKRIFEPYFSTKKERGTGLGLATVQAIVKMCAGSIDVKSREGHGTVIGVFLPLITGKPLQSSIVASERPKLRGGQERILVVDDESPVRNVICLSLQHLGYTVEVAASGIEALEKFRHSEEPFDLVILDMLMPQLSGDQVYFRLREMNPAVRVMLISGYSSEEAVKKVLEHGGLDFIQKPFTIDELSEKVRECIDMSLS